MAQHLQHAQLLLADGAVGGSDVQGQRVGGLLQLLRQRGGDLGEHIVEAVLLGQQRSEEHTSELQSLMRIPYAVFCLKKNNTSTSRSIVKNSSAHLCTHVNNAHREDHLIH